MSDAARSEEPESFARRAAWRGARAVSPLLPGVLPFAMIAGSSSIEVGFSVLQSLGLSLFLFAGASHLVLLEMWEQEAPVLVILATVLLVNLRFTMYSAALAPHLRDVRWQHKLPMAYLLTDQAALLSIPEFDKESASARWFYVGAGVVMWATWQIGSAAGILLGVRLPESWALDFAVPLSFLALLIPAVRTKTTVVAATVAGSSVLLTRFLPLNTGLITATLLGVAAGLWSERLE